MSDTLVIDGQTEDLVQYCFANLTPPNSQQEYYDWEENPFPTFSYIAQVSEGEPVYEKNYLVIILNEASIIAGLIIQFKNCSRIEMGLVYESIEEIAYQIIDFSIAVDKAGLREITNPWYSDTDQ